MKLLLSWTLFSSVVLLVLAVEDAAEDAAKLKIEIQALQQKVNNVSLAITKNDQEMKSNITNVKTQFDQSATGISNEKEKLKNFTCVLCENKLRDFASYDYVAAMNSSVFEANKTYQGAISPIKIQLGGFTTNLSNILAEVNDCEMDDECLKNVKSEFDKVNGDITGKLKTANSTIITAYQQLSKVVTKGVDAVIKVIQGKVSDVEGCFTKLSEAKGKVDTLGATVKNLISNASKNITQQNTIAYDLASKVSKSFNSYLEAQMTEVKRLVDTHQKDALDRKENIDACVSSIPELDTIEEDSKSTFKTGITQLETALSKAVNESIQSFQKDVPDTKKLEDNLNACADDTCIENVELEADNLLARSESDINQILLTLLGKGAQTQTGINSTETNVETRFNKELNETATKILDCLDYKTTDKDSLLKQVKKLISLTDKSITSINKTQNDTAEDFDKYKTGNTIITQFGSMKSLIDDLEKKLINFTHKACMDSEDAYNRAYSAFQEQSKNYIETYGKLFQTKRELIGNNVTQISNIEDDINKCKVESCLDKAAKDLARFDTLEADLDSLIDDTNKAITTLKNSVYKTLNDSATSSTPDGIKSQNCLSKLTKARDTLIKNGESLKEVLKKAQDHLLEQLSKADDFTNATNDKLDKNLTSEMNSTIFRIKVHKDHASEFKVNITSCGEEKTELDTAKNKSLGLSKDITTDFQVTIMKDLNATLEYIGKYETGKMLSDLSLCVDENSIDSLLNISNNASKDIGERLSILDVQIQDSEYAVDIKIEAIEESYLISAAKTYEEKSECIDKLWITKPRLLDDITHVNQSFVKYSNDLEQIKQAADKEVGEYKTDHIVQVYSAYKKNISQIEKDEEILKDFKYKVCKDSINIFKIDNYSKSIDEIFSGYQTEYGGQIEAMKNNTASVISKLVEIQENLVNCNDTDNDCLHNLFNQYDDYRQAKLNDSIREMSEYIKNLSAVVLQNVTHEIGRVSIEGDESIHCLTNLLLVKHDIDEKKELLVPAKKNLTDQLNNATIFGENEIKKFSGDLEVILMNFTNKIDQEAGHANKLGANLSACGTANEIQDEKNNSVVLFKKEIDNSYSEVNKLGSACSKAVEGLESNLSSAYVDLAACDSEACMDKIYKTVQKIKIETIDSLQKVLVYKINNFRRVSQSNYDEYFSNFTIEANKTTSAIIKCMVDAIPDSSTISSVSLLLLVVTLIIQLNFNVF